jgi:hypothetical protein
MHILILGWRDGEHSLEHLKGLQHKKIMGETNETLPNVNQNLPFIPQEQVSSRIAYMIDTPDLTFQGFTAMEICERVSRLGLNTEKISSLSLSQNGVITIQGENRNGSKIALLIDSRIFVDLGSTGIERAQAIEEISFDEAAANYQESISQFRESVVELDILSDAINRALKDNDNEVWEVIDGDDIITQGPFQWKTLVEAILIYKQKILNSSQNVRNLGNVDITEYPEIWEAKEKLYDANENYLLLILGIWEKREELTHVIPKSQSECLTLIQAVVNRRNPREILDWMKEIHAQIDANNWQDGTVEKNYKFFSDTLSTLALIKIKADIFENSESENYRKPDLLLEFAVFVSWRAAWNKESGLFMNDIWENASPVDSRLWMPELAEEALVYAMDLPQENGDGEAQSMISEMMKHIEITDSLLWDKTPEWVITNTIDKIKNSVLTPSTIEGGGTLGDLGNFDEILNWLRYSDIITKLENKSLWATYQELSLQEMISISWLLRISQWINKKQTHTRTEMRSTPYIAQAWETVQNHGNHWPWAPYISVITTTSETISYEDFWEIASDAAKDSVAHVWSELDKNFDDSWWQIWENRWLDDEDGDGNITNEANKHRADRFWINNGINSLEFQIFTLYNDINGNGDTWEFSDTSREWLKTAWFMLAMVAGSMLVWGWIVSAVHLARAAQLWITASQLALQWWTLSIAAQWSIMWMSWSALGYGIDTVAGDARGFYTPSEAVLWVWWDFILWGATWALSWPLAKFLPDGTPNPVIFGIDLTLLWLGPELYRMNRMNEAWHGSEIFTQDKNPITWGINDIRRWFLSYEWSDEQIMQYLENPYSEELSPNLKNYRFFLKELWLHRFTPEDIPLAFDIRFQKAYATWKMLNPGNHLSVWQIEPEFIQANEENRQNRSWWVVAWKQRILLAGEQWIQRQEMRFEKISL